MALQKIAKLLTPAFANDSEEFIKNLGEEIVLCDNGNVVFHWADFFETCDLIKKKASR